MTPDNRYQKAEPSNENPNVWVYKTDPDGRPIIHADGFVWRLKNWPVEKTTGYIKFLENRER